MEHQCDNRFAQFFKFFEHLNLVTLKFQSAVGMCFTGIMMLQCSDDYIGILHSSQHLFPVKRHILAHTGSISKIDTGIAQTIDQRYSSSKIGRICPGAMHLIAIRSNLPKYSNPGFFRKWKNTTIIL